MRGRDYRKKYQNLQYRSGNREGKEICKTWIWSQKSWGIMGSERKEEDEWRMTLKFIVGGWANGGIINEIGGHRVLHYDLI